MTHLEAKCRTLFIIRLQIQGRIEGNITNWWLKRWKLHHPSANPPHLALIPRHLEYLRFLATDMHTLLHKDRMKHSDCESVWRNLWLSPVAGDKWRRGTKLSITSFPRKNVFIRSALPGRQLPFVWRNGYTPPSPDSVRRETPTMGMDERADRCHEENGPQVDRGRLPVSTSIPPMPPHPHAT